MFGAATPSHCSRPYSDAGCWRCRSRLQATGNWMISDKRLTQQSPGRNDHSRVVQCSRVVTSFAWTVGVFVSGRPAIPRVLLSLDVVCVCAHMKSPWGEQNSWLPFSATRIMRAMHMVMAAGPVTTQKYREHLDTCLFSSGGDAVLHRTKCIGKAWLAVYSVFRF